MTHGKRQLEALSCEPQLPVPRFNLRQMFWFTTLAGLLLAAMVAVPGPRIASLAWLLAALVVALHVAGTALGSRLREHADRQRAWDASGAGGGKWSGAEEPLPEPRADREAATAIRVRPAISIYRHRGLPMPWLPLCVGIGAVVGLCLGAMLLAATVGNRASALSVLFGGVSTAVVGAWLAFLAASFWTILRRGWLDAVAEHRRDKRS
jgi:hypothetical protein